MNIAIVGSGISGLGAAYVLSRKHHVEIFEKAPWIGGHSHTVDVDGQPVDTGFIVYNEPNYPLLTKLFAELKVETIPSDMSFGVYNPGTGLAYSSRGLGGLLARPANLLSPDFYRMVRDILRFNREAEEALEDNSLGDLTLGQFLHNQGYSKAFERGYITPMSAAIWSSPPGSTLEFPAQTFFHFFRNHGLLSTSPDIPWRTVKGGSQTYVQALTRPFSEHVFLDCPVESIRRTKDGVYLSFADGPDHFYDHVVIATHADQALRLLADPTDEEIRLLSYFPYQTNRIVLHSDTSVLPPYRRAWASWTVRMPPEGQRARALAMTYDMNRLQSIAGERAYLVTLNPEQDWLEKQQSGSAQQKTIHYQTDYEHPAYTTDSFNMQRELRRLNKIRHTHYCGAYFGYGFHEDGLRSGVQVAGELGVEWR